MNGAQRVRGALEAPRSGRTALIAYLVAGFPTFRKTREAAWEAVEAGADLIEFGIPFSDPVADGPVLAQASHAALEAGATPSKCLEFFARLRSEGFPAPMLGMTYANLVEAADSYAALQRFRRAGLDGAIVPDVPHGESGDLRKRLAQLGLAHCGFVAPTTRPADAARAAASSTGFVYCVATFGTTGGAGRLELRALKKVAAALGPRRAAPLCAGFGIRSPEDVERIAGTGMDGVIVGTALAERLGRGEPLRPFLSGLARACRRP